MDESSAFTKRHIEEVTTAKQTFLEELNLSSEVIAYIRANKLLLWAIFIAIIVGICGYRYYNYYTDLQQNNSSMALAKALDIQDEVLRTPALQQVVADFGSTNAATMSKIAQARDLSAAKEYDKSIALLSEVYQGLSEGDAGYPLLVNGLGQLYEQKAELEQALSWYEKLLVTPGFKSFGYIATARIYEKMENSAKAKEMYENADTDVSLKPEVKSWLAAKIATL